MPDARPIVPPAGNPMRLAFVMFAIFFPGLMIGFPIYAYASGHPVGSAVGIVFVLGVAGAISLGILAWSGHKIERQRSHLGTTEVWAVWQVPDAEYRRFVRAEWHRMLRMALGMLVLPLILSVVFWIEADSPWPAIIVAGVSIVMVMVIVIVETPPRRPTNRAREVRIGAHGVEVMGRYSPLRGSRRSLGRIGLSSDDPPVLIFHVFENTRRRPHEVRAPVPADRLEEARAIIERFAPQPPAGETYPELLRRRKDATDTLTRT